jgi:hypothetical protein
MKILIVMDPHKGDMYAGQPDQQIQGQFGLQLPVASAVTTKDKRRIYVFDVEAAFEIEDVTP